MTYPGGKGSHYQKIINLIPPHRVYIETHLGGGAIARAKKPAARNILIDLDSAAIAAFGDSFDGGIATIDDTATNGDGCRHPSPKMTIPDPIVGSGDMVTPSDVASVAATLATNSDRISPARATTPKYDDARCAFELINTDALPWLLTYPFQGDEFVYCDPPYLMSTRRQYRPIYRCELSEADHMALLTCLLSLPCKVMLSGYWSQIYADALADWYTASFQAVTRGGSMATEWLWMNYPRPIRLHEYTYLGDGFRERERIKRKQRRWIERLKRMNLLERQAILAALDKVEFD